MDIKDGQEFEVEGATLKAFFTPGHTEDHMAFVLKEEDAMFTGDSMSPFSVRFFFLFGKRHLTYLIDVLGHGTAVFEDLMTYISSLEKMQHCFSGRVYPGHGAVVDDGRAKIVQYIQHRQQRENEVVRVLKFGTIDSGDDGEGQGKESLKSWTPIELVKVIYRDVPESLHLPASHGVLQVLMKLESEGKVSHDGESGGWCLNGRPAL